ncbi:Uncharacterized protein APZ42_017503 [Daphnia magna]|uniref:Uncharacterized protein n=1 Tax=Daphnia magna TaxID=35525 RepID=A0A164ZWR8_9CRUS|nr:Uncharacterized protein APZ42_017503 [Daphnia magna]
MTTWCAMVRNIIRPIVNTLWPPYVRSHGLSRANGLKRLFRKRLQYHKLLSLENHCNIL